MDGDLTWSAAIYKTHLVVGRSLFVDDGTTTRQLFSDLQVSRTRPMRIAVIVLIAMNMLSAVLTATSILYDSWSASRLQKALSNQRKRPKIAVDVHPAEVFPLAVSTAIILQGLVFTAVQGTGLQSVMVDHCTSVAQVVWPALWIVPYVTIVFGLEFVLRSLQKPRFLPRRKWSTVTCIGIVVVLLVLTWIPSAVSPSQEWCIANLVRWAMHFAPIAVIISSVLLLLLSSSAVILFLQLSRTSFIDRDERIAASRMVYHLTWSVFALGLLLPYYIDLTLQRTASVTSTMASVVLNLSGITTCLLHLFLRYVPAANAIRPRKILRRQRLSQSGLIEPPDLNFGTHINSPAQMPFVFDNGPAEKDWRDPMTSSSPDPLPPHKRMQRPPTLEVAGIAIANSTQRDSMHASELCPPPLVITPPSRPRAGSISYSLFPGSPPASSQQTSHVVIPDDCSTTSTLTADLVLRPPRPLFLKQHRRDSSLESSATIQFGLRLSHAPSSMLEEEVEENRSTSPLPSPLRLQLARQTSVNKPLPPPPKMEDRGSVVDNEKPSMLQRQFSGETSRGRRNGYTPWI
ncbi:MAG: hypothetical protein M4579_000225 [Chaenotheca gracillima]|nr:MAG: hypothetical protein M4579_000225 [Chaenotheca gracillima]